MRAAVTLADDGEIVSGNRDFYINVIPDLDAEVEYWDFVFPNGVHSILDRRNG